MRYDTYIPNDILKPYVRALVISEAEKEQTYKVLPDTGLVIGFQYSGKLAHVDGDKQVQLNTSGLTGLNDSYRIFKNSANIGTILVFFKEAGAANFFKEPIHELFGQSISLENFMLRSELLVLEEQLYESKTDVARIKVVERFLIARMNQGKQDTMVLSAVSLIHKSRGQIKITELVQQLNISQSPLEKRFRQVVGTSPKKFASIVRLKHVIQSHNPQNSLTELGYEAGFYDQAHFIKEFKSFTGDTPESFFAKE